MTKHWQRSSSSPDRRETSEPRRSKRIQSTNTGRSSSRSADPQPAPYRSRRSEKLGMGPDLRGKDLAWSAEGPPSAAPCGLFPPGVKIQSRFEESFMPNIVLL